MQSRYKIWTIAVASVAVLVVAMFSLGMRNQAAVARSGDPATVRTAAPAVQHSPIVPADVLAPIDANWRPLTGDQSN
jgi:hypothetical protein